MRLLLATALLALAAGSAAAQTEGPSSLGGAPAGVTAPDAAAPATGRRQPRRVDGGQPAPVKGAARSDGKPDVAEAARKAQASTAARDKAWDAKMKRTLGSICHGC